MHQTISVAGAASALNYDAALETAINKLGLSARAYSGVLKSAVRSPTSPAPKKFKPSISPKRFSIEAWTEGYKQLSISATAPNRVQ